VTPTLPRRIAATLSEPERQQRAVDAWRRAHKVLTDAMLNHRAAIWTTQQPGIYAVAWDRMYDSRLPLTIAELAKLLDLRRREAAAA
jgi:hypothetical protein